MYDFSTGISRILEWLCEGFRINDEPHHSEPLEGIQIVEHPDRPSSPLREHGIKHDIFVNHRGPDLKNGFVSFLEEALNAKGYKPFVDRSALKIGELNSEGINFAIQDARVHLALFSPRYAESPYCLEELVAMLECVKNDPYGIVKLIPIFFDVTPSHLRSVEKGPFQQAFQRHAGTSRAPRVPVWKKALRDAAEVMGIEKANFRTEGELKNNILLQVEKIMDAARVNRTQRVPRRNVGLQALLGLALQELGKMGDNVAIFGICGMGGIGKTTLAKEIYNYYSKGRFFEIHTFLELGKMNVRQLMKKALKELLDKEDENVIEKYRDYFNGLDRVSVLVVIDDISSAEHFTDLIPDLTKLGPGSRIILTSRDKDVLDRVFDEAPLANHLHEMQVLNPKESLELLCFHAFRTHKASSEFRLLAKNVAGLCGGLPLALEIIGLHLRSKPKEVWNEAAEIMRFQPGIIDVLSISYKGLSSERDKTMFLDVSCQMIGLLKQDAIDIWKSCALRSASGPHCTPDMCLTSRSVEDSFLNLRNKSLVVVGDDERLTMHDLLREMGRKMVGEELRNGKRRRLGQYSHLDPADAEIVLTEGAGTKEVRALSLVGLAGENKFNVPMFERMSEIHYLKLDGAHLEGDFSLLSKKIRWMQWRSSSLSSLPSQLHYSNLAVLDLSNSRSLTRLWTDGGTSQVPKLLKVLILQNCIALEDVPENINSLSMLRTLDLQGCRKLKRLPISLGELKALLNLNLNGCEDLESLPDGMVNLSNLKTFSMNGCVKIPKLPDDLGDLGALAIFSAEGASSLTSLPDSFSRLSSLDTLVLSNCSSFSQLPKSVKGLIKLRVIRAHKTAVRELPSDFGDLKSLAELIFIQCNQLQSLPESFGDLQQLTVLSLEKSLSFRRLSNGFGKLKNLTSLSLEDCPIEDDDLPRTFGGLEKLSSLSMQKNKMTKLPRSFRDLAGLTHLNMRECLDLADVGDLPESLEEVELGDCPKLLGVDLKKLTKLKKLILCNCKSLTKVEGLDHTKALMEINLSGCCNLSELQNDLLQHSTTGCFLSGSGVCLKYNNNWTQDGAPRSQLVSYYDHTLGFVENTMTGKISSSENANDLCMETSISKEKGIVQAVVISVVAHDQGWSDYAHLHGRYNGNCEIEARIVRPDAGVDVEVFVSVLFSLRHADFRDQVYICTLRRSHPLVEKLKPGDKICVYARSRYLKWAITIMQGNTYVAYEKPEWNVNDSFGNLYLKDSMSSSFQANPVPRVLQAFSVRCEIAIQNSNGDVPDAVFARMVLEQLPFQENRLLILERPVMLPESFKFCDICGNIISDRGFHCNTCADFDMCQICITASPEVQSAHPADHPWTAFEVPELPANGFRPFLLPDDGNPNINWGYVVNGFLWSDCFPVSVNTGDFLLPIELLSVEQ